ncbi:MAG: hypothetical protein IT580_18965, partial [Verrucomicrobiales bacterium]|nr:hypothetical protein [Verrucomicrobiales bacterium]
MSTPPASLPSLSTSTSTPALPLHASAQRRGGIGRPPWALALAAVFGYGVAQWADPSLGGTPKASAVNPYEALPTPSFSEVATVKLTLENLLQEHFRALHTRGSPTTPPDRNGPLRTDPQATYRLEQLIREFAGTDQALVMTGMLLSTLKRQEDWQRWLDVYL